LIGLGEPPRQIPALVVEARPGAHPETREARERFEAELRGIARVNPRSETVRHIVFQRALPVDVRHNAKIHRLRLAEEWTARLAP
ncbi:MAG: peptide synthase, partial [Verrucomicrobiota bacterium]